MPFAKIREWHFVLRKKYALMKQKTRKCLFYKKIYVCETKALQIIEDLSCSENTVAGIPKTRADVSSVV